MHRKIKNRWVVVKDPLRPVSMVNVPIQNRDAFDFFMSLLRVTRGHTYVVEKTETHGPIGRGVMARRPHGHKGIAGGPVDHQIDRLTRCTRTAQSGFQRLAGNHRVGIQVAPTFAHNLFDMLKMLW